MESLRDELIRLIEEKAIPPNKISKAIDLASIKPTPNAWFTFMNHLLLWVGSAALGLSCIFFIAHNWSDIGRFAKFALVEGALIFTIIVYIKIPPNTSASNASLIVATLLLGALMALFGQTYQTGADPWQLFFNWALFITPWALIARFTSIWIIWLVLLNLSIILYCDVNQNPLSLLFNSKIDVVWLFFLFNTLSFVGWYLLSSTCIWMQKVWAIRMIALAAGFSITFLSLSAIFDENIMNSLALPMWAVFFATIYWVYRRLTIDLFMLSGACLSGILVVISFIGHQVASLDDIGGLLLLSIIVIGLGVASAFWLKKVQMELN